MSMIIGSKGIPMFKVGYPTVSDKYNVAPAVLTGDNPVGFGALVKHSDTKGYFEAIKGAVTLDKVAGFVVATNVKLAEDFPGTKVQVNPSEAFNLLVDGFLAVELDANAKEAEILANKPVAVVLATGKLTSKVVDATAPALPNTVFTGLYEKHGNVLVAEILVK